MMTEWTDQYHIFRGSLLPILHPLRLQIEDFQALYEAEHYQLWPLLLYWDFVQIQFQLTLISLEAYQVQIQLFHDIELLLQLPHRTKPLRRAFCFMSVRQVRRA